MLEQFHRFESNVTAPDGGSCRWHARYVLEEAEIRRALTCSEHRRTSPVKIAVESGIVAVIGMLCLVNYFTDPARTTSTLTIGILCFVLAAIASLYSPVSVWLLARGEARKQKIVNVWISDTGIGFGKQPEHYSELAFNELTVLPAEDMLVLMPGKNSLVALPKCAVDEECWAFLQQKLTISYTKRQLREQQKGTNQ